MRNKNAKVSNPNDFFINAGDVDHIEYSSKVNLDGTITLSESGKWNIDEYINSFRDQCDMNYIIKQLELGNIEVLNRKTPMYGDFTDMPKSYAEALQLIIDGQKAFDQLPLDVRNSFDNDFNQWFATAGSESWISKMSDKVDVETDSSGEVKE